MSDETNPGGARTLTTPVLSAGLFVAACAVFAITFVAARGGLAMPTIAPGAVAEATAEPTEEPFPTEAPPTLAPTPVPTLAPTAPPTLAPTPSPTPPVGLRPTLAPDDPLLELPECPDHPGCFVYVIQRYDRFSRIVAHYGLDQEVILALNPDLVDPSLIVTGHTLYLGRDRFVRLDPCPNAEPCALYAVESRDTLTEIAERYALTRDAILAANPDMPRPIQPGQIIRLPLPF